MIAYLYGDIDPDVRATFEAHLAGCDRCRTELRTLGGVRKHLEQWAPPEPNFTHAAAVQPRPTPVVPAGSQSWWREMPAWAQVAAALLFLGTSAGIANLDVRYDRNGLAVRTGWSRGAATAASTAPPAGTRPVTAVREDASAPWRSDLSALEQQLRAEIRGMQPVAALPRAAANDAEIVRRVRTLIDESERRQQNELALRVGETIAEINAKRRSDAQQVRNALRETENKVGVVGAEVVKTRASLNYILMNASQRQ